MRFVSELDQSPQPPQDKKKITKRINECLHSVDGEGDIRALNEIVQQIAHRHSLCEPEFIDQLYDFNKRCDDNATVGILKRKLSHGLLQFSTLFAAQTVLTCKRNLEAKLSEAEHSDEALRQSLDVVENDQTIRAQVESIIPNTEAHLVEDIISTKTLKRLRNSSGILHTVANQESAEQFVRVKEACKLIDSYAQGSIYPIVRFANDGLKASDDNNATDNELKSSLLVTRWLNIYQYCQGVSLVDGAASVDVPESLAKQVLSVELNAKLEPKKFQIADQFEDIGWDLKGSYYSTEPRAKGIKRFIGGGIDKLNHKFL